MSLGVARLVVRAFEPDRHRTDDVGYLNSDIQVAFAVMLHAIAETYPRRKVLFLVGDKSSGTAFGTVTRLLYPDRFRFYPTHHTENYEGLQAVPTDQLILVDDFLFAGNTVRKIRPNIPFGRMVVLKAEPEGMQVARESARLHVLAHDNWLHGYAKESPHRGRNSREVSA